MVLLLRVRAKYVGGSSTPKWDTPKWDGRRMTSQTSLRRTDVPGIL
jgi:hypothetical protein